MLAGLRTLDIDKRQPVAGGNPDHERSAAAHTIALHTWRQASEARLQHKARLRRQQPVPLNKHFLHRHSCDRRDPNSLGKVRNIIPKTVADCKVLLTCMKIYSLLVTHWRSAFRKHDRSQQPGKPELSRHRNDAVHNGERAQGAAQTG